MFKNAPNPNAARLLQSYMFSAEGQQVMIDVAGYALGPIRRPGKARPQVAVADQADEDAPEAVDREAENIKKRYSQIFKV